MITCRDPRVVKAEFDVWLARDMVFNNPASRELKMYPRFTKARKVKYTNAILRELDDRENRGDHMRGDSAGQAVAILLDGTPRYVWRSDVYTKEEMHDAQKSQKAGLRVLRQKREGTVD